MPSSAGGVLLAFVEVMLDQRCLLSEVLQCRVLWPGQCIDATTLQVGVRSSVTYCFQQDR
jgi:hypothetical protein